MLQCWSPEVLLISSTGFLLHLQVGVRFRRVGVRVGVRVGIRVGTPNMPPTTTTTIVIIIIIIIIPDEQ